MCLTQSLNPANRLALTFSEIVRPFGHDAPWIEHAKWTILPAACAGFPPEPGKSWTWSLGRKAWGPI